ncbi:MAG: glucoamylase family protein, partial [Longimicrobiales bacterium]
GVVWRGMWPGVALAGAALAAVLIRETLVPAAAATPGWELLVAVVPLILAWLASPAVAYALRVPAVPREQRLSSAARRQALRYALLHWRFFDRFVTADTNWLAPDNFQEGPRPVVAMRTSPTNIGLQLLATMSAWDLGFITLEDMTRRLELAFRTLERMRRFHGHFYNWYDLHTLGVLEPGYVSTVDSGNLAGHLIALRQACLSIGDDPVFDVRAWSALEVALTLAVDGLDAFAESDAADDAPRRAGEAAGALLRDALAALATARGSTPSPSSLATLAVSLERAGEELAGDGTAQPAGEWIAWSLGLVTDYGAALEGVGARPEGGFPTLRQLAPTSRRAADLLARLDALAGRAYAYAQEMDFRVLFDRRREVFAIGYQQTSHTLDDSYYDLLASEARLASFVAIAKGDVPVEHWFRLGRGLTRAAGETALVSWSGSMFEYLMPALVMRSFPFTMLDQTYRGAVRRQIEYGAERGVPWGVSESAYNLRDRHLTYQYRAFGVPDLALKRGLGRDLVVAPYASALAAMVEPRRALANLNALAEKGALGRYGFRDALDYTRPEGGLRYAVVGTYMAHHIGMGLIALTNVLAGNLWQRRFHADPLVRSAELLLHERIPRRLILQKPQHTRADEALPEPELEQPAVREFETPDTPRPHVALLGRSPYTIMISHAG